MNHAIAIVYLVLLLTLNACATNQPPPVMFGHGDEFVGYIPRGAGSLSPCEIRLHVEKTDSKRIGSYDADDARKGTCIKRVGQSLKIPSAIKLAFEDAQSVDVDDLLPLHSLKRNITPICIEEDLKEGVGSCTWNGTVRDKFPLSFRITSEIPGFVLSDRIQLVHLYLNGTRLFAWNGSQTETEIRIPSQLYGKANGMPYGADLDLQIVPVGVSVEASLAMAPVESADKFDWITRSARLALDTASAQAPANLKTNLQCLVYQTDSVSKTLRALAHREETVLISSAPPAGCDDLDIPAKYKDVAAFINSVESGVGLVDNKRQRAENFFRRLNQWLTTDAPTATAAAKASVTAGGPNTEVIMGELAKINLMTKELESLASNSAQMLVRSLLASRQLALQARRISADTTLQAQIFADYASRLEAAGGPFQDRKSNPSPITGASVLFMNYVDVFQGFFLAPWHCVPVRVFGNDKGAELTVGNAIPVIDIGGVRWQWARNRLADFRLGVGVFYLPFEIEEGDKTKEIYNPGVETNAAISNLHIGFGYIVRKIDDKWTSGSHFRLMVGLDLYKLITGENLEAL